MNRFYATAFIFIALIAFSCTDNDRTTVSPVEPELLGNMDNFTSACRANMRTIASQQIIYFASHEHYAATLEELGMAGVTCPQCGLDYFMEANESDFSIHCPLPSDPTHGSIIDGMATWTTFGGMVECQANIRTMVSANLIFYAENCRFANSLEELGFEDSTCPGCGNHYAYHTYDNGESFYISCPIPLFDCHGSFDSNSGFSWSASQGHEYECRANMRTIASQEVIYFANHGEYTENMEDIGMAGVVCPECGEPYILRAGGDKFYIECGKPSDPNHGCIDNGVASW